jgi:hypothetical protein
MGTCVHPRSLLRARLVIFLNFCFMFFFICLSSFHILCPMLHVSLYCPFLSAPSVFSNVYLQVLTDIYNNISVAVSFLHRSTEPKPVQPFIALSISRHWRESSSHNLALIVN